MSDADTPRPEARRPAWIDTVDEADATGALAEHYRAERDPHTGKVDHILKLHSLIPESLADHASLYHHTMHAPGETTLGERELVGLVVSDLNGCHY